MAGLSLSVDGDIAMAFKAKQEPLERAVNAAMEEFAGIVKTKARAHISPALGSRVAQATTVRAYDNPGINDAVYLVSRVPWSGIFERGGPIRPTGGGLLWLPLPGTPKQIGGKHTTPSLYAKSVGPLRSVTRPGKKPLLFGKRPDGTSGPLFIGQQIVNIPKKLNVRGVVEDAASQLPALVAKHLKDA